MICKDKQRLLEDYQHVTEKYSAAVTELQREMGMLSKADYDALYRMTEALRHDVTIAQEKLQSHVRDHHC
jgi:hypothetical protein